MKNRNTFRLSFTCNPPPMNVKTLPNLPSQGGFAPWTPLIGRVLNRGALPPGPPRDLRSNYLLEWKGEVVVWLMNAVGKKYEIQMKNKML